MKLHSDAHDSYPRINAYDRHSVTVAGTRVTSTFIITPDGLEAPVTVPEPTQLRWRHLGLLHGGDIQIFILGTGAVQEFPSPELFAELARHRVGLEVMDSPAACRTYNILVAEGRRVAALIVL